MRSSGYAASAFASSVATAALAVFSIRQAMVIGPTPPGTGVKARAWSISSNATSPTIE